jgi:hypothetical protein
MITVTINNQNPLTDYTHTELVIIVLEQPLATFFCLEGSFKSLTLTTKPYIVTPQKTVIISTLIPSEAHISFTLCF